MHNFLVKEKCLLLYNFNLIWLLSIPELLQVIFHN